MRLYGLGTALPAARASQETVHHFMSRLLEASLGGREASRSRSFLDRVYAASGIQKRHSVLGDYARRDAGEFEFFPRNWRLEPFPTTGERMAVFEKASVDLAEKASRKALAEAGVSPGRVTHLILATCTGLFAPGPDILLIERLGLAPDVRRTQIGFMGCYAGFTALRTAEQILRGDPEALVLLVCVELCSLHFQKRPLPDFIVANSLFADGACAALCGAAGSLKGGLADLEATHSHVSRDSLDQMSWRIGPTGFEMRLDRRVPATLRAAAPGFVEGLLRRAGVARDEVVGWAVHPGGRRIVEEVQGALGLGDAAVRSAYDVLGSCGNMSSGTIFFVLDRELRARGRPGPVAAVGFGPGLTMEGALLTRL